MTCDRKPSNTIIIWCEMDSFLTKKTHLVLNQPCQHLVSEFLVQILNLGASCPQEEMHWDQSHRQNLSPRDGHLTATGRLESISFNDTPFHPKTKRIKRQHKKSYVSLPFSKPNKTLKKNTLSYKDIRCSFVFFLTPRCSTGWASQTISPSWDSVELQIYDLRKKASPMRCYQIESTKFVALKKCNNLQVFLKISTGDQWMAESQLLDFMEINRTILLPIWYPPGN